MNKSLITGTVLGVGLAVAGGVAGFALLENEGSAPAAEQAATSETVARATTAERNCYEKQVTTQARPKDENRIAGTVIGALVGGAVGKDVGEDDVTAAAGAAAGAYAGRKAQKEYQENNTQTKTETVCEPRE